MGLAHRFQCMAPFVQNVGLKFNALHQQRRDKFSFFVTTPPLLIYQINKSISRKKAGPNKA
jgi:hypothetical protein